MAWRLAIKYVRHLEELIERPVTLLSTSPQRHDTVLMSDPFEERGGAFGSLGRHYRLNGELPPLSPWGQMGVQNSLFAMGSGTRHIRWTLGKRKQVA